jgi:hypothetical protein
MIPTVLRLVRLDHTQCCVKVQFDRFLLVSPNDLVGKMHNVDVVHKFNHAIILYLRSWYDIFASLFIIIGLQVGQTTVVIFLQRIYHYVDQSLMSTGYNLPCPCPCRSGLNIQS